MKEKGIEKIIFILYLCCAFYCIFNCTQDKILFVFLEKKIIDQNFMISKRQKYIYVIYIIYFKKLLMLNCRYNPSIVDIILCEVLGIHIFKY